MPGSAELLESFTRIANDAYALAVAWHAVIAVVAWRIALGARPSRQAAATLLALPLASVAGVALGFGNLFNAVVCGGLAIALAALGARLEELRAHGGPTWAIVAGVAMIALGVAYPHFLEQRSIAAWLIGAPVGLLPCPTLFLVVGAALCGGGFGGRAWTLVLSAAGLWYGLVGSLWLGVRIDMLLAAGSAALAVAALARPHARLIQH